MPSPSALTISIPSPPSTSSVLPTVPQSSSEIERELSSVRSLRRRSGSASGSLGTFDPDLPPTKDDLEVASGLGMALPGTSLSPTRSSPTSGVGRGVGRGGSSPVDRRGGQPFRTSEAADDDDESDRDAQLFWVPAHLHPELAPSEFRAFLKEHAHAHAQEAEDAPPGAFPSSSSSSSSAAGALSQTTGASPFASPVQRASSLSRKRSMLSRQYTPRANDGVEAEEHTPALPARTLSHRARNRSSIYASPFATDEEPGVSLMDLQKLEEMADEAAKSDDPSALRSLLKRSWSVNTGSSRASLLSIADRLSALPWTPADACFARRRCSSPPQPMPTPSTAWP